MQGSPEVPQEKIDGIHRGYRVLESYLTATKWMASNDRITLADLAIFAWMESITQVFTVEKYPKITAWLSEMRKLPYYEEANKAGADLHIKIFKDALEKNKNK
jgi:glutathione S-transferase